MRLYVAASILKREFGRSISAGDHAVLIRALRPDLLFAIKGAGLPAQSKLLKGYATSENGACRLVCLLMVGADELHLLFFRPKNDPIGQNVSVENPAFKVALAKHLALLREDVARGRLHEITDQG